MEILLRRGQKCLLSYLVL